MPPDDRQPHNDDDNDAGSHTRSTLPLANRDS